MTTAARKPYLCAANAALKRRSTRSLRIPRLLAVIVVLGAALHL